MWPATVRASRVSGDGDGTTAHGKAGGGRCPHGFRRPYSTLAWPRGDVGRARRPCEAHVCARCGTCDGPAFPPTGSGPDSTSMPAGASGCHADTRPLPHTSNMRPGPRVPIGRFQKPRGSRRYRCTRLRAFSLLVRALKYSSLIQRLSNVQALPEVQYKLKQDPTSASYGIQGAAGRRVLLSSGLVFACWSVIRQWDTVVQPRVDTQSMGHSRKAGMFGGRSEGSRLARGHGGVGQGHGGAPGSKATSWSLPRGSGLPLPPHRKEIGSWFRPEQVDRKASAGILQVNHN